MNFKETTFVGIAGGTCSGKSFLSNLLLKHYGKDLISIIKLDSYYIDLSHLSMEERNKNNFDHPDSFDFDLLYEDLLKLNQTKSINIPVYDYKTHTRTNKVLEIKKNKIIIIEGILSLFHEKIRDLMSIKCFIDIPSNERKIMRLKRDVDNRARTKESILLQYSTSVEPMYIKYIEKTKKFANIIIQEKSIINNKSFKILTTEINNFLN